MNTVCVSELSENWDLGIKKIMTKSDASPTPRDYMLRPTAINIVAETSFLSLSHLRHIHLRDTTHDQHTDTPDDFAHCFECLIWFLFI